MKTHLNCYLSVLVKLNHSSQHCAHSGDSRGLYQDRPILRKMARCYRVNSRKFRFDRRRKDKNGILLIWNLVGKLKSTQFWNLKKILGEKKLPMFIFFARQIDDFYSGIYLYNFLITNLLLREILRRYSSSQAKRFLNTSYRASLIHTASHSSTIINA